MRYRDLTGFQPVETVIHLRSTGDPERAAEIVKSYVVTPSIASGLISDVLPMLALDGAAPRGGVMVTGGFGSGKSHLLATLAAVAEFGDLAGAIADPAVAKAAQGMAGRYKVLRAEIGPMRLSLPELLLALLEERLAELGVQWEQRPATGHESPVQALSMIMEAFLRQYPDQGIMLIVDDLSDYLASRKQQPLMSDLFFLQALAEMAARYPIRFVAGLQSVVLDDLRYDSLTLALAKVLARFTVQRIGDQDLQVVIAKRLLPKAGEQRKLVADYLRRFHAGHRVLREQEGLFVDLFPVHPAFVAMVASVRHEGKVGVLRSLSAAVGRWLEDDVPLRTPGLISYDSYWPLLRENPSLRNLPGVRELAACADMLEYVAHKSLGPQKESVRLIHALAVLRLTAADAKKPPGASAQTLADDLLINAQQIDRTFAAIREAADEQFLAVTGDGTYYLDPNLRIDARTRIAQAAQAVALHELNGAYYSVLRRALELPGTRPETWPYELPWADRMVMRRGHLVLGDFDTHWDRLAGDFMLYFRSPFSVPRSLDELHPKAVVFSLGHVPAHFQDTLRSYRAAVDLASRASGSSRAEYAHLADELLRLLVSMLNESDLGWVAEAPGQAIARPALPGQSLRQWVDEAAANLLAPYFEGLAPEYPHFRIFLAEGMRTEAAVDAIKQIAHGTSTRSGSAVLDSLLLTGGGRIDALGSPYARYLLEKLKDAGGVLHRNDLLVRQGGDEYLAPGRLRLEVEWVAVLLAALIYDAGIVVESAGKRVDAWTLQHTRSDIIDQLMAFTRILRESESDLVSIDARELVSALAPHAMPVSPAELERRLHTYLTQLIRGRNPNDVRILIRDK